MTDPAPDTVTRTVPFGPIDVRLEEPIYFELAVQGETIRDLEIYAGHVHRGIEYLTTKRTVYQNVVLTERICSLCSNTHPETFAMAAEAIAGLEIPPRAEFLRVIAAEIKRVASNLFNVGVLAHLVGDEQLFMHVLGVREIAQDLKETIFGNRMDLGAICIGGVRYDLDADMRAHLRAELGKLAPLVDGIVATYAQDQAILERTRGTGILTPERALDCGVVGPVARASASAYDVRTHAPYAAYDQIEVPVATLTDGDVWSRAMIRLHEARAAIDLISQSLDRLPEGPTRLPGQPEIPPGQAIAKAEAPRGELIYFLRTNDTPEPERVKWRVPTFLNWEALRFMMTGARVDDVALIVNSIDPCISCTER